MENDETPKLKLEFAPGCFDNFEGTQEELDELVAEIHRLVESGEILEQSFNLSDEDIPEDVLEELQDKISEMWDEDGNVSSSGRLLN